MVFEALEIVHSIGLTPGWWTRTAGVRTLRPKAASGVRTGLTAQVGPPPSEVKDWCAEMIRKDRLGYICDKEFRDLREQFSNS